MNIIYKYELALTYKSIIKLPANSTILSLQTQSGIPCIWVWMDVGKKTEVEVILYTIPTGQVTDLENAKFLGTYQLAEGALVFHVFYADND